MSTKDHIVILKKIPVDPRHVEALRLHRDTPTSGHGTRSSRPYIPPIQHDEMVRTTGSTQEALYRMFSFLLFAAFLVNPIGVAYAEEVAVIPDAPEESAPVEEQPAPPPVPGVTIVVPPSDVSQDNGEETPVPADVPATLPDENVPAEEPTEGTVTGETETLPVGDTASSTEESLPDESGTSTGATTTEESADPIPPLDTDSAGTSTATSTDEGSETASTTEEVAESEDAVAEERAEIAMTNLDREQTPEERAAEREVAEAAMREQIKKEVEAEMRSKCVSYGGDGYYCLDANSENQVTDQAPVEQVISSREGGGDKEIILVRTLPEGESRVAITTNDVDDEFPSADGEMRMIVWQSLIDGRWQIAYKEGSGSVEYLTATPDGNGHPATDGKRIVWQGWSSGNWDIFLAEPGSAEASFSMSSSSVSSGIHPAWKATKISQGTSHDMFPKIAGNFVTWQEHRGDEWVIVVYDLSTGQTRTVKGEAGGTGEAPTVALIFKERTKEGRILIRASDLATGERIPLREDELPEPARLPIPEQSGALPLQSGTSSVTSIRAEGDGDGGTPEI